MSVLIKDMEMPDCCFHCVCSDDGCGITGDTLTTKEMRERPDWCPLEELPERKNGKWLPDDSNNYEERFICSMCGKSYKVDTCMGEPMWDFCPCGADMRGERNV